MGRERSVDEQPAALKLDRRAATLRAVSPEAKIEEAANAPYRAFVPAPDTELVETPELRYVLTPSAQEGSSNEVRFAALDADVDAVIDRVLATYAAHGCSLRWVISPGSRPADLGERLRARGLESWWARAMSCETAMPIEVPGDVEVELVEDERALAVFVRTMLEAWQLGSEGSLRAHVARARAQRRHHMFVVRVAGELAGAAQWSDLGTSAYLGGAAVLSAFRGRGAYRALVAARLAHALGVGRTLATTQARERTSAPILDRLGFETLYRFEMLATPAARAR